MITIEASTLEEAFEKAAQQLECSVTCLEFQIVQNPKKGFLGFGKKNAIIVAACNQQPCSQQEAEEPQPSEEAQHKQEEDTESIIVSQTLEVVDIDETPETPSESTEEESHTYTTSSQDEGIIDTFFQEKKGMDEIILEVKECLNLLFEHICFDIDDIQVEAYDDNTLYIEFSGSDAALLIGKEGYRYKALSYMLFNWINTQYGLMIRLEIAEFLKNQEEMIARYLEPIIENIYRDGRGQTKPLDGVLAHIALKQLRDEFPDKYVSFRQNNDGDRFVIVNEFKESSRNHH